MFEIRTQTRPTNVYCGRFAPSPSGFLHFGSLIAALASYLDAKHQQGLWLVRIEDIDPPREKKGASQAILTTLEAFGLHWDEDVLYQSNQTALYQDVLNDLAIHHQSYYCQCTRAQIKALGAIYTGHCKRLALGKQNCATRIMNNSAVTDYLDIIQGKVQCNKALAQEDFILVRKDSLFAYQLAVVIDDIYQGISHVLRGCDLLEPTARQLSFYSILQTPPPVFGHVPLAVTPEGYKLSKQNNAPAINDEHPQPALLAALKFLGQKPPEDLIFSSVNEIISWAIQHWSLSSVPKNQQIVLNHR